MLALIFITLSANGNEKKLLWDQDILTTNFNSPGPTLISNPLTESLKQVSFWRKFVRLTYTRTIMKMTTISPC